MKLTKKQRHNLYVKVYNLIAEEQQVYICLALLAASPRIGEAYDKGDLLLTYFMLDHFPELRLFEPNIPDITGGWWLDERSKESRLNALGFMIAMTE